MSQAAKANEPTMEEILASIRKIISDDDTKPAETAPVAKAPAPAAEPAEEVPQSQDDIDALMASFDSVEEEPEPPPPPPKAKKEPPAPVKEPEADIFELTDAVSVPLPKANNDLDFAEPEQPLMPPPPAPVAARPAPSPVRASVEDFEPLLSGDAQKAVGAAFSSLGALSLSHGGTLDGLVREMLRPMLKQWLDEQLPPLVERLVRAEIERATRGGR